MADFKSTLIRDKYGNEVECTLLDQLKVTSQIRLCGGVFNDSVLDPSFFTATTAANGAAAVSNSVLTLSTTVDSGSAIGVASNRVARYIGSSSNFFRGNIRLNDTGTANNTRYWGAFNGTTTPTSGFFFMLSGTTFSIGSIAVGGTIESVANGGFNGKLSTWIVDTICHTYEIYYSINKIQFVIDGVLIHELRQTITPLTGEVHFRSNIINANTGVGSVVSICCMALTISRLGEMNSSPMYKNISTATTTLCKTGPGNLHRITVNNPTNNAVTVYDNTAASGTIIATINPGASATPIVLEYGCDFQAGLTIVTAGTTNLTVIYE